MATVYIWTDKHITGPELARIAKDCAWHFGAHCTVEWVSASVCLFTEPSGTLSFMEVDEDFLLVLDCATRTCPQLRFLVEATGLEVFCCKEVS